MKYLLLAVLLMFPALASAQSDYSVSWNIIGGISKNKYDLLMLDINEGTKFLSLNGVLSSSTLKASTPATGTCFFWI